MAETAIRLYGDVVTENIHEQHSGEKAVRKTGLSTLGKTCSNSPRNFQILFESTNNKKSPSLASDRWKSGFGEI